MYASNTKTYEIPGKLSHKEVYAPCKDNEKDDETTLEEVTKPKEKIPKDWNISNDQYLENILGEINKGVTTRQHISKFCQYYTFVSHFEPTNIRNSILDMHWLNQNLNKWDMGLNIPIIMSLRHWHTLGF